MSSATTADESYGSLTQQNVQCKLTKNITTVCPSEFSIVCLLSNKEQHYWHFAVLGRVDTFQDCQYPRIAARGATLTEIR